MPVNRLLLPCSAVLLAALLSGCITVGPDYRSPETAMPAAWTQLSQTTGAWQAQDLSSWWQQLDDPRLSSLISEALQANLDLQTAHSRLREARARRNVAAAGQVPEIGASGQAAFSEASDDSGGGSRESYRAGFDASWELDLFGRTRRTVEAAEADLEATEASLRDVQVSLIAEVATGYIELRTSQLRRTITQNNLTAQSETLQLVTWRAEAGLADRQEVVQALANREQTRAQMPRLETDIIQARHRLELLLGRQPGSLAERLDKVADLPTLPPRIGVGIPADTLRQRPDIVRAERTLAAETARLGAAEADRFPSFALSGSIGVEALRFAALTSSGAVAGSLIAGVSAPLFDGGRLRNQVLIQDEVRHQAEIAYRQSILTALQEVENSLVALVRAEQRRTTLAGAAAAAAEAAQLAQLRYRGGVIDFQAVLDTERARLSIEDSLASSRAEALLALIGLYKALGGGWSAPTAASFDDEKLP